MVRKFKDDVVLGWKVKYIDIGDGMIHAKVIGMQKPHEYMGTGFNKTQAKKSVTKALTTYNTKYRKVATPIKISPIKANQKTNDKTESGIINSFKRAVAEGKMGTASDKYQEYKKAITTAKKNGASNTQIKNMEARAKTMANLRIKRESADRGKWFKQQIGK